MRYISTRGGAQPQSFTEILLEGLAPDGGLFVPEAFAQFSPAELDRLRPLGYSDLAFKVLSCFADDIPRDDLRALVERSYTPAVFGSADITPLTTLAPNLHLLELSNGPTLAFKDMAMQFLGHLFEYVLGKQGRMLNILGATSGDTGSSAEHAMKGKRGVNVFMLSPDGRMSPFQRAQMYALQEANIFNIAVRGVFDDCQDVVKAVSSDAAFKTKYQIGAVNSINWARVAAQAVYYFKGYFAATRASAAPVDPVDFVVPSGNFGNVYAGYVAKCMGLPIRRLIVATNENDVLAEFFRTGRYRVRKNAEVHATSSPSMDISKASNFERFVFAVVGRDAEVVRALWAQLDRDGVFDLRGTLHWTNVARSGFAAGRSSHADRIATIREVSGRYGRVIDPHTADGLKVALELREPGVPTICLETALPAKFAETIREALGRDPVRPAGFENIESLPQRCVVMDPDPQVVKDYIAQAVLR